MTLNNPVFCLSSSSRTEASGTHLCPHLAWLRRRWRSSSCCILSVTPPFVCGRSSMLHGQEQHCQASFIYSGHSSAGHLPEDMLGCFVTFYCSWKGADLEYLERRLDEAALLPAEKCCWSLIHLLNSYLMVSSVVGFYSLRVFEVLTPRKDDTTMTTVKMGWKGRGEVGARVLRLLLWCWCVWDPLCFIYFLFFSPLSRLPLCSELLLLTNVFLRAPQWL